MLHSQHLPASLHDCLQLSDKCVIRSHTLANATLPTLRGLSIIAIMRLLRFSALLLLAAVSTRAATLSGTVRDSERAVIANAHVIAHWDPSGSNYLPDNLGIRQDITATSDSKGQFSLELPPGFYDIFVTATAFSPHCDKIRLKGNQIKTYVIKLKVSPVTSKELD